MEMELDDFVEQLESNVENYYYEQGQNISSFLKSCRLTEEEEEKTLDYITLYIHLLDEKEQIPQYGKDVSEKAARFTFAAAGAAGGFAGYVFGDLFYNKGVSGAVTGAIVSPFLEVFAGPLRKTAGALAECCYKDRLEREHERIQTDFLNALVSTE